MDHKELPPPYTSTSNDQLLQDKKFTSSPIQDRGYIPQPIPSHTYQPLYIMNQPPPSAPAPSAIVTNVTVSSNDGRGTGSCPICHARSWTGSYSCCAWLICIFCFPCGLICCCCMRKKKCTKCGFTVS